MKNIEVTLYLKNRKKPLATVVLSDNHQVKQLVEKLKSDEHIFVYGELIINNEEFSYATIKRK